MSHAVTITRTTTTTTNTSYIVLNTGYLTTIPGILKLLQLLLGIACVGIFGYYINYSYYVPLDRSPQLYFFLVTTTFMIGTFLLFLSCLISLSTGSILSKTIYELIYHLFAGILVLIAGLVVVIELRKYNTNQYNAYMAAGVMAIVNGILYLISAFFANRSYRGI